MTRYASTNKQRPMSPSADLQRTMEPTTCHQSINQSLTTNDKPPHAEYRLIRTANHKKKKKPQLNQYSVKSTASSPSAIHARRNHTAKRKHSPHHHTISSISHHRITLATSPSSESGQASRRCMPLKHVNNIRPKKREGGKQRHSHPNPNRHPCIPLPNGRPETFQPLHCLFMFDAGDVPLFPPKSSKDGAESLTVLVYFPLTLDLLPSSAASHWPASLPVPG
ncbi:hypothetical protein V8C35DRAFT_116737 [Trichoderma chlorosporum]